MRRGQPAHLQSCLTHLSLIQQQDLRGTILATAAPQFNNRGVETRVFRSTVDLRAQFKLSTPIAIPCPPPMQAVASPYFFFRRRNSYSKVITSRVPVAPSGCPNAIAPPFTLTFSRSKPNSFSTPKYCAANASFTSIKSM